MPRYFAHLAYKGTAFHGWQIQPNAPSVQEELNKALSTLLKSPIETTGCGRTDTGVHATSFVAHFDSPNVPDDTSRLIFQLNALLPLSIRVYDLFKVDDTAHSRFDANRRSYSYYISRSASPFFTDYTWYNTRPLQLDKMNEAAARCLTHQDFTCFSKAGGQQQTNICTIYHCSWKMKGALLCFDVSANRFLRNMVRAMVGTMMDVGMEKMSLEEFSTLLTSGTRSDAGQSVPSQGLFLEEVVYPYYKPVRNYFFER